MSSSKSSFTRLSTRKNAFTNESVSSRKLPRGSKPSVHNGQLLISSGLQELDEILGGGIAVGSVILLEEEIYTEHFLALLKYFLVEGLANDHVIAVISADKSTGDIVRKLPRNLMYEEALLQSTLENSKNDHVKDSDSGEQSFAPKESMKIAWQYEKYLNAKSTPQVQLMPISESINRSGSLKASKVQSFCHSYDLSRSERAEFMKEKTIEEINPMDLEISSGASSYKRVFRKLHNLIENGFKSNPTDQKESVIPNILRIGVHSLGSSLWSLSNQLGTETELFQFLHALRGLLRSSLASCMITMPVHLMDSIMVKRVEHLCDTVISCQSFDGIGRKISSAFAPFHGQLLVKKMPRLNSLVSHLPETLSYVYKMSRRKFHIEILHLGPEESRSHSKSTVSKVKQSMPSLLCSPIQANKAPSASVDF